MKCEEVRDEMIAYLKGELDEERKKEVDEHLARCKGCQQELEMSQKVLFQTQAANESSIVEMADSIIQDAINANASDIHIDPTDEGTDVRYRVDGVLHCVKQLPAETCDALVARFKIMDGIPIVKSGMPQDGRSTVRMNGRDYDLRVSIMPFIRGEKVVVRILDKRTPLLGLDKLGFLPEQLELVKSLLHQPNGEIIIAGPTGSGKTTTLYSMLLDIKNPAINIMAIEDPVEFTLSGIQQAQVYSKTGLTFAAAIRAFLRQDPDIIMVGEIRDMETALLAAHASMTGHLVLSALNERDAVSVPKRMIHLGLEPWLVGTSLIGVIAQLLVRETCRDCREEYTPDNEALEFLGLKNQVGKVKFYRGAGCEKCKSTGVRGRTGIFEVLEIDRELGRMISDRKDADAILKCAVQKGFVTMAEVARRKVLEGITTAEEAYRVFSLR